MSMCEGGGLYDGTGLYDGIEGEEDRPVAAWRVENNVPDIMQPGPAVKFEIKFEPAVPQAAPAPNPFKPSRVVQPPSAAQLGLILLSRQRRDDVLNDLCDWAKRDGRFNAKCWRRLTFALLGQGLDVLYRVGEVVRKLRGAK